jgi:hypothetical protein
MTKILPIPPDVTEYLLEASKAIAIEQGFIPASKEHAGLWLMENLQAIALRASEMQLDMFQKVQQNPVLGEVLCTHVWAEIHRRDIAEQEAAGYQKAFDKGYRHYG